MNAQEKVVEARFKNLQVLKDVPHEMRSDCHDVGSSRPVSYRDFLTIASS